MVAFSPGCPGLPNQTASTHVEHGIAARVPEHPGAGRATGRTGTHDADSGGHSCSHRAGSRPDAPSNRPHRTAGPARGRFGRPAHLTSP